MLLHLGANKSILKKDIIAIIDYEAVKSSLTAEFVHRNKKADKIIEVDSADKYKSLVITEDRIYISPISPEALQRRTQGYPKS